MAVKDKKKVVKKKKKSNADIYEEVTAKVIASLETGEVPWKKPWISKTFMNYVSKRPYRGVNPFLLSISASVNDYNSPYWLTIKQANELSIKKWLKANGLKDNAENRDSYADNYKDNSTGIRKGEKATMIIFWSVFEVEDEDSEDGKKTIKYLKYINVFNTDQTDLGITYEKPDEEFSPIEDAAKVIKDWEDKPNINHTGFDRACYIPSQDIIEMPKQGDFVSPELYYKILYHECIHATGHKSRVGRVNDWTTFGSDPYAKEELVAELGASFLLNYVGIENEDTEENTEAYIKNWIAKLKSDPKLIVQASSQAQKGADYILGTKYEPVEDKE